MVFTKIFSTLQLNREQQDEASGEPVKPPVSVISG